MIAPMRDSRGAGHFLSDGHGRAKRGREDRVDKST